MERRKQHNFDSICIRRLREIGTELMIDGMEDKLKHFVEFVLIDSDEHFRKMGDRANENHKNSI
jgi:hypothetical protein